MPVLFIGFTIGVGKISYPLLNFSWALTALFLLSYNRNFLQGVGSEYSLAFILSVLISFSICLLYMARINQRSEWLNRQWHSQALTDPLTQLPNLRALEQFLLQDAGQSVFIYAWKTRISEPSLRYADARALRTRGVSHVAAAAAGKGENFPSAGQ